jgi:tetratricopeptide (TPR) repeat protein
VESYDKAISVDSGLMPAWFNKSSELIRKGAWKEALQAIEIALSIRQNDAVCWYVKGLIHANLKQGQKAKAALVRAQATGAKLYPVEYLFGGVLYFSRAYHPVSADDARTLAPGHGDARSWYKTGETLYRDYHYEEAVGAIDRALVLDAGAARSWILRGLALHKLGRYTESLLSLDHALSVSPGMSGTWLNRGLLLLQMNRNREALESFEHALALRPENKRVINAIAFAKEKIAASAGRGDFKKGLAGE